MTAPGEEEPVSSDFVRSYVITGGRSLPVTRTNLHCTPSSRWLPSGLLRSGPGPK
ncbi:hypothetical protein SHIRM173S_13104 [Streptomyces hirsutus]